MEERSVGHAKAGWTEDRLRPGGGLGTLMGSVPWPSRKAGGV